MKSRESTYRSSAGDALSVRRRLVGLFRQVCAICTIVGLISCTDQVAPSTSNADIDWRYYGGEAGGSKYSALGDINRTNVAKLELAWSVQLGTPTDTGTQGCVQCWRAQTRHETTPLVYDGILIIATPFGRLLGLDPSTGQTKWVFDAEIDPNVMRVEGFTTRGIALWTDSDELSADGCRARVFFATTDQRLFAVNPVDGRPCRDFGRDGMVYLNTTAERERQNDSSSSVTSPPTVIADLVVVGSAIPKIIGREAIVGVVRAFDARTGEERWAYTPSGSTSDSNTVYGPQSRNHPPGGANVWSIMSADSARDLLFLPTSGPSPNFYGALRPGRNEYANSIVALRGSTGAVVWAYQLIHHDLWDYDVATQPLLLNYKHHGRDVPAVVVGTKSGMIFVFHRETGVALHDIREISVPASDVAGEDSWPTQPVSEFARDLHGGPLSPDSAFGLTQDDRRFCRDWMSRLRNEGLFTPPSEQGTLLWPGVWGGLNWDGLAWDPRRGLIIATVKRLAMAVTVRTVTPPSDLSRPLESDYVNATLEPLVSESGVPCSPPPWGYLIAIEVPSGLIRWRTELGQIPTLSHLKESKRWGSIMFGAPLVTGGGLIFVGATQDDMLRALDTETGKVLWQHRLPGGGQANPITYRHGGHQYVAIAAGGRAGIGTFGDWLVAFRIGRP